jgi:hypothetical protein
MKTDEIHVKLKIGGITRDARIYFDDPINIKDLADNDIEIIKI